MSARCFVLVLVCSLAGLAQNLGELLAKAPPDVDGALRATVTKFYQAHVDGKFRLADELVAEDSKDAFFEADKRRCRSFQIGTVKYSDNFTRARVLVTCDTDMLMPFAGRVAVKMPLTSLWKLVGGHWWWYVEPRSEQGKEQPGILGAKPAGPGIKPVDLATVSSLVKVDKQELHIDSSAAASERVVITNEMPGPVGLSLESKELPGLTLNLAPAKLKPRESATLSIHYEPSAGRRPRELTVRITVSPTQQLIPIRIHFKTTSAHRAN